MITIRELLEEAKETLPSFKEGQFFETLKPIFNGANTITVNNVRVSSPMAVDKKSKKEFEKYNSPLKGFFKNKTKGDILQVVEVNEDGAKCINLSLNEEIKERYYKNKYVFINYEDLITGTVKQVKRNIDKYIQED